MSLALVLFAGCSKSKGTITGKVTLKDGTPVPVGNITFWGADNRPAGGSQLKSDGTYNIADAPVGDVKVTIETPPPRMGPVNMPKPPEGMSMPKEMLPKEGGDAADPTKKVVPVPAKYKTAGDTPLTYTIVKGTQEKNFTLEP